jgi:hypothetical protein
MTFSLVVHDPKSLVFTGLGTTGRVYRGERGCPEERLTRPTPKVPAAAGKRA